MTVDVHGRAGLSMSKPSRDCLRVDVLRDQERRGCVPEPVERYQRKLVRRILAFIVLPEDALEDRVRRRRIHLFTIPLNENEVVSGPFGSDREPVLLLLGLILPCERDDAGRDADEPIRALILRDLVHDLPVDDCSRFADADLLLVEIEVFPCKRDELPAPEATEQSEMEQENMLQLNLPGVVGSVQRFQEGRCLLRSEVLYIIGGLRCPRCLDALARILSDHIPVNGSLKNARYAGMTAADRGGAIGRRISISLLRFYLMREIIVKRDQVSGAELGELHIADGRKDVLLKKEVVKLDGGVLKLFLCIESPPLNDKFREGDFLAFQIIAGLYFPLKVQGELLQRLLVLLLGPVRIRMEGRSLNYLLSGGVAAVADSDPVGVSSFCDVGHSVSLPF